MVLVLLNRYLRINLAYDALINQSQIVDLMSLVITSLRWGLWMDYVLLVVLYCSFRFKGIPIWKTLVKLFCWVFFQDDMLFFIIHLKLSGCIALPGDPLTCHLWLPTRSLLWCLIFILTFILVWTLLAEVLNDQQRFSGKKMLRLWDLLFPISGLDIELINLMLFLCFTVWNRTRFALVCIYYLIP